MATEKEEKRKPETEESGHDNFDKAADLSLILQELLILTRKLHEPAYKTGKDLTDVDLFAIEIVLIKLSKKVLIIIQSLLNILRSPKRNKEIFLDLVEEAEYISTVSGELLLLSELKVQKRFESAISYKWLMLEDVSSSLLKFNRDIKVCLYHVLNYVDSNITPQITKIVHSALDKMGFLQVALLKLTESVSRVDEEQLSFQSYLRNFAVWRYWNFPPCRESGNIMKLCEDINAKLKTIHTMQEGKLVMGSEQETSKERSREEYEYWNVFPWSEYDIETNLYEDLNAELKTIHPMQEGKLVMESEQGTSKESSREEYKISNFDGDWNETDNLMKLLEDALNLKLKSNLQRREKILVATSEKETSKERPYEEHKKSSSSYSLNENFPESDELVSKLTDAKQDLESLRTWFLSEMRDTGLKQKQPSFRTKRNASSLRDEPCADDKLEDHCEKSDQPCGINEHHQGQIKSEPKTIGEHKAITQDERLSELFGAYNSCVALKADLTHVLECYDTFRKSERISVAESRHEAEIKEIANVIIEKNCLEMSHKDTATSKVTMAEYSLQETSGEISVQSQSSSQLENVQVSSLRDSLLRAQEHLSLLNKTLRHKEVTLTDVDKQMDTDPNLQSKTIKYKYFLETLENTLEFALKYVNTPMNSEVTAKLDHENTAISSNLRDQAQMQTNEELGACSGTDTKQSAELKSFEEFGNDNNSFASLYSTSSWRTISVTLNIPLVESNNDDPLQTSIKSSIYGVPEKVEADFDSTFLDRLSKVSTVTAVNVLSTYSESQATQTQCGHLQEPPSPIVSKRWQASTCFSSVGGTLRTPHSDVSLCVPRNAVNPGEYVDVHVAVSTDLELARQLVKMSPEEYIVGPIVEYWAGETFCFEKPVCISIPHCLQSNVDHEMVRVYRVSKLADGRVYFVRIRPLRDVNNSEPRETRIQNQLLNSEMEESHKGVTCRLPSEISQDHVHQDVKAKGNLFDVTSKDSSNILSQEQDSEIMVEWDDGSSFHLSSDGKVYVSTTHFSAYVCTYCGHSREPPTLAILACGSRERREDGQQTANILILVGDERIHIVDFQHAYGNGHPKLAERVFPLPSQELQDSSIYMRLRIVGKSREMWSHCQDTLDKIGCPEVQSLPLHGLVSCDNNTCKNIKTKPLVLEWLLESSEGQDPATCLCVVDICHRNDWDCLESQKMSLTVRDMTKTRGNALDVTLNNLLALDTADLENVAQFLEVRERHIEELRQRFHDEQSYRYQLSQKCLSKPDCSKVLERLYPMHTAGLNNALSRMSLTDNYNCNPSYIHIENTSVQSSNQEPSIQARLRSAQDNIDASAIHTSTRQSYAGALYPDRCRTNLPESKHNYLVFTSPEADCNQSVSTWNQNTLKDTSTPFLVTPGNNASTHNFFNNRLDRLSSLPPANNEFNISHNSPLNNTSPNCMNQSLIAYQRQLPAVSMEPEDPAQIERALSEIPFDDLSQFPQLSSPTTEF